jgi:hypothetical protein
MPAYLVNEVETPALKNWSLTPAVMKHMNGLLVEQ